MNQIRRSLLGEILPTVRIMTLAHAKFHQTGQMVILVLGFTSQNRMGSTIIAQEPLSKSAESSSSGTVSQFVERTCSGRGCSMFCGLFAVLL